MLHHLEAVLDAGELAELRTLCDAEDAFQDGAKTAGWAAKRVKANRQMKPGARLDAARRIAQTALHRHPVFAAASVPARFVSTLVSRTGPGGAYGAHVDDAVMGGRRADLSFTIFLSDPDAYEGGELVLHGSDGETRVKPPAGDAIVYPTGAVHEVAPITKNERLAVVGWVRSFVRRSDQRAVLFDLDLAARAVFEREENSETFRRLQAARTNLLRMWAED